MKTKRNSKTSTLSPVQLAWMAARALVDVKAAEYQAEKNARGLNDRKEMTEAECDAVTLAQEELADELGYYAAKDVLRAAEDALLAWSFAHALAFRPSAKAEIDTLRANAWKPAVRVKLIDIASRLAA